ncbi:MAG TPA: alpha/beta hydrolase [Pseudomonadota bacterium]|nr:alpha/beta hydrolase [Pseudomonadota bacterium]
MELLKSFTGRRVPLPGFSEPVFVADFPGPAGTAGAPQVVLVHGLGGAHTNWGLVGKRLSGRVRTLAVDLSGFGRTPWLGSSKIDRQVELVTALLRAEAQKPVLLVGNSMGGLIALRVAATAPELVSSLLLVSPLVPHPRFKPLDPETVRMLSPGLPLIGPYLYERHLARRGSAALVQGLMRLLATEPDRIDPEFIEAQIALFEERRQFPWALPAFVQAIRSSFLAVIDPNRYFAALSGLRHVPHILHGERDRVVQLIAAQAAVARCPAWRLEVLSGIGHTAMIEVPDLVCERIYERL